MVIEFERISKSYGGVHALSKASLSLKSNDIRALLGGNGSGKSTLIKVAGRLAAQDEGNIFIDGRKLEINSPKDAKAYKIIATSQELSILPNLSVGENITLCKIPKHAGAFTDRKTIREESLIVLKRLGLENEIDTPIGALSINKQYLIEFGKAIFQDFDILLIDEVTSALYREDVAVVKRILDEYKAEGKIILFVSHRLSELYSICDSVTVMRNGEVIETHDIKEVNDDILLSLMIGKKKDEITGEDVPDQSYTGDIPKVCSLEEESGSFISLRGLPIERYSTKIDLDIKRGEIIGVAGLQGHGQSDIVRALHGLKGPIEVVKNGKTIHISNPGQAVRHKFAFISGDRELEGAFKYHNLSDNLTTVHELVLKNKDLKVDDTLKDMNVKCESSMQNITSLSGGNQQKVIVGRWIHTKPDLLLADDPSKGIDVRARSELRQFLWKLAENGTSIIFVSSDEDELVSLCSPAVNARVIMLYEGKIVATLKGREITRDNIITATLAKGGAAVK